MYREWPTWLPLGNMLAFVVGVCLAHVFAQWVGATWSLTAAYVGGALWLAFSTLCLIKKE